MAGEQTPATSVALAAAIVLFAVARFPAYRSQMRKLGAESGSPPASSTVYGWRAAASAAHAVLLATAQGASGRVLLAPTLTFVSITSMRSRMPAWPQRLWCVLAIGASTYYGQNRRGVHYSASPGPASSGRT